MQKTISTRLIARSAFVLAAMMCAAVTALSQTAEKGVNKPDPGLARASAAYAEILLRKTELLADLEAFAEDYTVTNPKIIDLRFEMSALDRSLEKVFAVKGAEASKLTQALGRLIVRKAGLETELNHLLLSYNKDHPNVKRMKRRVEIFDAAIKEVLP